MMLREIIATVLITAGMLVFATAILGVYRFDYVLNRMHAAALGDTMGLFLSLAGVCVLYWDLFPMLKILLILMFMWMTNPISSHMIARTESMTNRKMIDHLSDLVNLDEGDDNHDIN